MYQNQTVAVVIPALNEEQSIERVVGGLRDLQDTNTCQPLIDDIVVCDNGSTDATALLAKQAGARVVFESEPGYGAACLAAISALRSPDIVVFVDADHSVVSEDVPSLLAPFGLGADLVIGSRALGDQQRGALTFQQKFGNWLASTLINILWKHPFTDLGPFRAVTFRCLNGLNMQDRAFGWTVEMQVKAIQNQYHVSEVPVSTLKRMGRSKISGTISGTIGAAKGIFGMIFKLYLDERKTNNAMPARIRNPK